MLHKTAFLASGLLATMMLTPASSYADNYYSTPANRDYAPYQSEVPDKISYDKAAKRACRREIRDQIHSDRHNVQDINFDRDSFDVREAYNGKTRVRGQGKLLTGKRRWLNFDFKCTYNSYNDRVTKASYRWTSGDQSRPAYDRAMPQACKREIYRHILRNHGSAFHRRQGQDPTFRIQLHLQSSPGLYPQCMGNR